jgi:TP901 family phage tail tape measure protein
MVAGVAVAAKRYADFDQALSHVAATGTDARMNLGALRETAIQMGADTVFSATEAAQGIEAMEKAGLSAKDILGGGLKGSLDLAAAGTLEVGQAAEIAATALVQFGLSGSDMSHVADLLAAGAGKAQGEVSDLAMAFKYVGPIASAMNISIEETVGTLAAFASQGILADQAGTSLRGVLAALTSPSKQAQAEIERLHVTLYDGNGKFLGMTNLAGQLAAAYDGTGESAKKATDAEKDMSLGILFGNQQVTAARVLLDQGAKGIEDWTKKVDEAGYASSAAATRMDNLKGRRAAVRFDRFGPDPVRHRPERCAPEHGAGRRVCR